MIRAGFASVDITPPRENSLIGYEFRQEQLPPGNAGVHDPLLARVTVLDDGGARAAIVCLDLAVLRTVMARRVRARAAERVGTDPARVMVCCSHTHSGPFPQLAEDVGERGFLSSFVETRQGPGHNPDPLYAEWLLDRVDEAAASAAGLTYPVEASAAEAALGMGYNRRVPDGAGGVEHCWNTQEFPMLTPGEMLDPTCTLLMLAQPDGPRKLLLWSVGVHGVVLGKTSRVVSADWPGAACRMIERMLPGARPMFLQGASGDTHPWVATQEDPAQLDVVAAPAAGLVTLLTQGTRGRRRQELRIAAETCEVAGVELDLAAWRIGPVTIAAAPVELFQSLALDLRAQVDGPLIVATCTNGWSGYWPDRKSFGEGGYEVEGARRSGLEPGAGEALIDALARLVRQVGCDERK